MKIKILNKHSDYLALYRSLSLEELVKTPVIVKTRYYSQFALVCRHAKISRAVDKFCKTFIKYLPQMPVWRILMLSNLYFQIAEQSKVAPGGAYKYKIDDLGNNYYSIFLEVSGAFDCANCDKGGNESGASSGGII